MLAAGGGRLPQDRHRLIDSDQKTMQPRLLIGIKDAE
jgi:hypothetical protein